MSHEEAIRIRVTLNGEERTLTARPTATLLDALRAAGLTSVKYGCGVGDCGVCTVLVDGQPVRSCQVKVREVEGRDVLTAEGLACPPQAGAQDWETLHPLQRAFIEVGAIQCGYCTPAQILTAKALLDRNPDPTEAEIREALSGVLCRCTGYVKIVQAVQRAAAMLRGEPVPPFAPVRVTLAAEESSASVVTRHCHPTEEGIQPPPLVISPPEMSPLQVVGQGEPKVDGVKLALGRPAFTDDIKLEGMLYGALLTSPHAHARIRRIDASRARALPGVHAVLTCQDIPRVKFASGGQSFPATAPVRPGRAG
jgi:putative selenate reductase molybdopterin-binding subunit